MWSFIGNPETWDEVGEIGKTGDKDTAMWIGN